jgi:hypothetical protein
MCSANFKEALKSPLGLGGYYGAGVGKKDKPADPPAAMKATPPPTKTAAVVKPAGRRGSGAKRGKRKGTGQLTVRRPTLGGSYSGSGVNLPS